VLRSTLGLQQQVLLEEQILLFVDVKPTTTTDYILTVLNANGTCSDTAHYQVIANQFSLAVSTTQTSCNALGSATVTVTANVNDVTYYWSSGTVVGPTATMTNTLSNLAVGTYSVTVVNNTTGCRDSVYFTITSVSGSFSAFVNNTTPVTCFGRTDGTLLLFNILMLPEHQQVYGQIVPG
jgi:hypothetical protein